MRLLSTTKLNRSFLIFSFQVQRQQLLSRAAIIEPLLLVVGSIGNVLSRTYRRRFVRDKLDWLIYRFLRHFVGSGVNEFDLELNSG